MADVFVDRVDVNTFTVTIIRTVTKHCFHSQTLATFTKDLQSIFRTGLSLVLGTMDLKPFVSVTPEELVFGYDDVLTNLAHKFFPRHKRPNKKMGLLLGVSVHKEIIHFCDVHEM